MFGFKKREKELLGVINSIENDLLYLKRNIEKFNKLFQYVLDFEIIDGYWECEKERLIKTGYILTDNTSDGQQLWIKSKDMK